MRNAYGGTAAQNRSFDSLARAGQPLLDSAATAGALRPGVTLKDLLLLVNAVADVCSDSNADIDRLLNLAWNGARRTPASFAC